MKYVVETSTGTVCVEGKDFQIDPEGRLFVIAETPEAATTCVFNTGKWYSIVPSTAGES